MDDIYGFKAELPLGMRLPGKERVRSFDLLKAGGVTENFSADHTFRQKHLHRWFCMMVASVLERIGPHEVYRPWRETGFAHDRIPEPVMRLHFEDLFYVFILGHMYNYGPILKCGEQPCAKCGEENSYDAVDLRRMQVVPGTLTDLDEFQVRLDPGFLWEKPAGASDASHYGKHWNVYYHRLPTMADWILREDDDTMRGASYVDFNMRVYSDCIARVERWDGDQKVEELTRSQINMLGRELVDKLESADRGRIRARHGEVTQPATTVKDICRNRACRRDVRILLDPRLFYPAA
jgi:hypothetical protein